MTAKKHRFLIEKTTKKTLKIDFVSKLYELVSRSWTHKNKWKAKHILFAQSVNQHLLQVAMQTLRPKVNNPTPNLAKYVLT